MIKAYYWYYQFVRQIMCLWKLFLIFITLIISARGKGRVDSGLIIGDAIVLHEAVRPE